MYLLAIAIRKMTRKVINIPSIINELLKAKPFNSNEFVIAL